MSKRQEEALLEVAQELKELVSVVEYKRFERQVGELSISEAWGDLPDVMRVRLQRGERGNVP